MSFVFRMALRETRASWLRLAFFFTCVAIGVAAIVVLRSVVQNVRATLVREASEIVGADLVVQSTRAWTDETRAILERGLSGAAVLSRVEVIETRTMASTRATGASAGRVRLVELRGISPGFPIYGRVELESGGVLEHSALTGFGAGAPPEFLMEMGLRIGDVVRLGGRDFTIRGVVTKDRVQRGTGGFAFGPRLYVSIDDLKSLGLLGFGSSATYQTYLRIGGERLDELAASLRKSFANQTVNVRSWRTYEDRLGRNLVTAENYLSLVGFAMVVLGGIGVWSVTRVIVQQKVRSVAILKCLGATSRQILATYLLQVLWLAAGGSALGIGVAALVLAAIPASVLQPLGVSSVSVTMSAALQGFAVGLLVSLFFALVPLLEMRLVKPLLLLRADTAARARRSDYASRLAGVLMLASLAAVAVWQAGSVRAGLFVSGGLAVAWLLLLIVSRVLIRVTSRLTRSRSFALRHATISLARPGNQTRVVLMAVGLGCFFVLSVRAMQQNLLAEFDAQVGASSPDMVLIDVQHDQTDGVQKAIAPHVLEPARIMPLMRARVVGVFGAKTVLENADAVRRHGRLTREFGVTYRDAPASNETVVSGAFWNGPATGPPPPGDDGEVSISEEVRDDAGVRVGDSMRLDVAGQPIRVRVTSIRRVSWDETQNGGFFFVLRPSPAVSRLPHSFVGFVRTGEDAARRAGLQRVLVDGFPNVTVIDVRAVVASVRDVLDNITLGITVVGIVTLVSGVLILIGAVAMTKFQRLYDAAIYRTLGAGTRLIATMVAVEYGLLGTLAGLVGAAGAFGLSWALSRYLFEIVWRPAPGLLAAGAVITALLVSVIGLAASLDVLARKPLGALRSE